MCSNSFSLLVPDVNTADVTVLSQNVVLSINLVGRWQRPDYDNVTHNSISFPIFYQSDGGLYKFYVTGLDGEEELAIQIFLSIMGMPLRHAAANINHASGAAHPLKVVRQRIV